MVFTGLRMTEAGTPSTEEEKKALQQTNGCWKALRKTDYGWGVTHLQEMKRGDYVGFYEGTFIDQKFNTFGIPALDPANIKRPYPMKRIASYFTPTGSSGNSGLITAKDFGELWFYSTPTQIEYEVKAY